MKECVSVVAIALVAQSCPTLCDPTDCSPPGSSVPEILRGRTLEWVAIPFSRGSSRKPGLNPGLLHCGQILYHLSHQGCPVFQQRILIHCLCTSVPKKDNFKFLFMKERFPRQRDHKSREVILQPRGTDEKRGIKSKFLLLRVWSEAQKHRYFWKLLDS